MFNFDGPRKQDEHCAFALGRQRRDPRNVQRNLELER
jgi:hypothetical protein